MAKEISIAVLAALEQFTPKLIESSKNPAKAVAEKLIQLQQSTISKLKKKIDRKRKIENVSVKKKGHEEQCNHTAEVLETVDDALQSIDTNNFEEAKNSLEKGKLLLETRLKYIRIADRNGWLAVKEFKSDELWGTQRKRD